MPILFASPKWHEYSIFLETAFKANGLNFNEITTDQKIDPDTVEFIIYSSDSSLKDFSPFKNMKAVLNLWAGVEDIIQNKTLTKPLIRLVDVGMKQGMVEWCLAHVLRHHLLTDIHVKNQDGIWRSNTVPPLATEVTVGILGLGALGTAVATALSGVGFKVKGWSQTPKIIKNIESFSGRNSLPRVLESAQILILLLPLTPNTKFMINSQTLNLLPKDAIIINPGRGYLINDDDLLAAFDSGHISHATLDVFSKEPLPTTHPYWNHPKVTVTPHIAAHTRPQSSADTIAQNIVKIRRGENPVGLVNPTKFY